MKAKYTKEQNKLNSEMFNKGMSHGSYLARKQIVEELQIQIKRYQKKNGYFMGVLKDEE